MACVPINCDFAVSFEITRPHFECNCRLQAYKYCKCGCGAFHLQAVATAAIGRDEILTAHTEVEDATMVQFDGSAHRTQEIGGAGAALLRIDPGPRGLKLIKWGAVALSARKDNIVVEAYGAELAMHLYADYAKECRLRQHAPLPLDIIQGDIKPLIQHLQFAGRFRHSDLIAIVDKFHSLKSRLAPKALPEYRPREVNFLADYLAGVASQTLLLAKQRNERLPIAPQRIQVELPYEVLLTKHASVLGEHQGGRVVLALREVPCCDFSVVEQYATSASV